jgi:hypothetical protein
MYNILLKLEQRLSIKEEQSLEKDLILEQVHRLIERLSTKADAGKDDTLALAKKVNDLQNKIKDITRKMMATLSELTIHQSDALKLQQEKNMKDVELQQYYARMEQVCFDMFSENLNGLVFLLFLSGRTSE